MTIIKIWENSEKRQMIETSIAFKVLSILNELDYQNIKFTSGDADKIFRILNKIYFKVKLDKSCEPSSFQREIIFKKYPNIFPRKK